MKRSWGLGIDLGGTKCAAGLMDWDQAQIVKRLQIPTKSQRGGEAIFQDIVQLIHQLQAVARNAGETLSAVGIGIPELVSPQGEILSEATIPWRNWQLADRLRLETGLLVLVEADVRAAALAETTWGAGQNVSHLLYVTVGTGISACYVVNGQPMRGARGLTGTFASSPVTVPCAVDQKLVSSLPLEEFASGPALARRYQQHVPEFQGTGQEVVSMAAAGDPLAALILESAGTAVGAAVAMLVNILDPALVILGGGLGCEPGRYRDQLQKGLRDHVWSDLHREVPVCSSHWNNDAGWIGAAWGAHTNSDL